MPIIDDKAPGFMPAQGPVTPEPEAPTWGETFESQFRLNNDVLNAVDLMTQPVFKPKDDYIPGEDLRTRDRENGTDFFENYRDNFVGSQSPEETSYIMSRITQENNDRNVAMRSGFGGAVVGVAAGLLSPTTLMPLVGPATRVRTAWETARAAATLGMGAGILQEGVLQSNQETRTNMETATGIASMTILSGILGGVVGKMTANELKASAKALNESAVVVRPGSVGAAANDTMENAGTLARGGQTIQKGIDKTGIATNPISYNVMHETWNGGVRSHSEVARYATTQLGDGGFRFELNDAGVPTAKGGTLENLVQTHYNIYPDVIKSLDEGFLDYRLEGTAPKFGGLRTMFADVTGQTGGKLTKTEYKEAVMAALRNGDNHPLPQVAVTSKFIREKMFNPMLKEAQAAGVISGDLDLKGDLSWVLRDYNRDVIRKNTQEFVEILASHFEKKLVDEFAQAATRLKASQQRSKELVEDLSTPADQVEAVKQAYVDKLKELDEGANNQHLNALEDTIGNLRAQARALRTDKSLDALAQRKDMLKDAKDLEAQAGTPWKEFKASRADVRRRLSNLNRAHATLEARQADKLERLDRMEDLSMDALRRAAKAGQRMLKDVDKWDNRKLNKEVSRLKNLFADAAKVYDAGEERLVTLVNDQELAKAVSLREVQEVRAGKLSDVAEQLETASGKVTSHADAVDFIEAVMEQSLLKINKLNAGRAIRSERLRGAAEALDPAQALKRIEDVKAKAQAKQLDFMDNWRLRGADDVDLDGGIAVFKNFAKEQAVASKERIMGTFVRLPSVSKLPGDRGSEIERVLDIPSLPIAKFLNNDVESVMRQTLRTLAPDIEIAKRFGDANATDILGDPSKGQGGKLADEMNQRLDAVKAWGDAEKAAGKDAAKIDKEMMKRTEDVNDTYASYRRNLEAMIGRLRHTWGLPTDPEAIGFRLGKLMLNVNTVRLMGGVAISSIPDIARPIFRYGLIRTMKDGFIPLFTSFKDMRLTMKEIKWLAGGLDATMQSRGSAIFDLLDDVGRGSKFEQGVEAASRQIGMVGLFDQWTSTMKQFSGAVAHAKFMDSIDTIVNGGKNIDVKEATRFLAENGIDQDIAEKIWGQMVKAGGADKVDGRWWPNTAEWDPAVRQSYSQAITREVNNSIITPGIDKPLWMDQTMMGRIVGQFRSFTLASTSRTVVSGMQQRDWAVVNGSLASLAFGALGYYVYAMAAGGDIQKKMENATFAVWADEMLQRSGLLGIFGEVQRIAENIPATQPYATFSGVRSTRRGGDNLVEALAGPSLGMVGTAADVVTSAGDMNSKNVHQLRTLVPFQNIFYLRRLFDMMEDAAPVKD